MSFPSAFDPGAVVARPVSTVIGSVCCQSASSGRSAMTGPTTIRVAAPAGMPATSAPAVARVEIRTSWSGRVALLISATGSVAAGPPRSAVRRSGRSAAAPCRTPAPRTRATAPPSPHRPVRRWNRCPVANATLRASRRCVSGMPAAAVPPIPALIPGTMRNAMPAAASETRFLAATPKHQRIAALQPHHPQALARKLDQPVVDPQLLGAHAAGALARQFQPCLRRQRQDRIRHQRVMHHHVGLTQRVRRMQCQQAGIAGPAPTSQTEPGSKRGPTRPGKSIETGRLRAREDHTNERA